MKMTSIGRVDFSYSRSHIITCPFIGCMLPNLSPSLNPNLYKVQSVYNNNVAL